MEFAPEMIRTPTFFTHDTVTLAYHHVEGAGPGLLFCGGFKSHMNGGKAEALELWARAQGRAFTRFDYRGHGASSGRFEDGTLSQWVADALAILDHVTQGPQILIGSSMGGMIMLKLTLARPARVVGLVGIASAPDFIEELIWRRLDASARQTLATTGVWYRPSAYDDGTPDPITRRLIEDGRQHVLLPAPIPISVPVRLLHGMADEDVPWSFSQRLCAGLTSHDVQLILVKDGDHRLSRPQDLRLIRVTVANLIADLAVD